MAEKSKNINNITSAKDASLADVLALCLDSSVNFNMLNQEDAQHRLENIWKLAALIEGESNEEILKRLMDFQRQEVEESREKGEPSEERPVPKTPVITPVKAPTIIPQQTTPTPELAVKKHFDFQPKEWNTVISLNSPRTDGGWPQVPTSPPAGFPFSAEDLKDGPSIRALFQKAETWTIIKEMAANPAKRGLIQSYLVPMIVLATGKSWWNINKRQKQLGNAPFGLFSPEEYKLLSSKDTNMDDTDTGRAFIALINWHVAKTVEFYLATAGQFDKRKKIRFGRIDGYIYNALDYYMLKDAAKRYGFTGERKPVCAYCKRKRVLETTPPQLVETVTHQTKEDGKHRRRPIFQCPTCAEMVESQEKELRLKEQGLANAKESLEQVETLLKDGYERFTKEPSKELQFRLDNWSGMKKGFQASITSISQESNNLRQELNNRSLMINIPYQHLVCINENCPGKTIPLTFIDWINPFWKTPDGAAAKQKLANNYGIIEKTAGQEASDTNQPAGVISKSGKMPPEWMWDVPFRCPFDDAHFSPRQAFGHGYLDRRGHNMGGLFVDPPRTNFWSKPESLEQLTEQKKDKIWYVPEAGETKEILEEKEGEEEGKEREPLNWGESEETENQLIEKMRAQTGIQETTESPDFLADQEEKKAYQSFEELLRQELYLNKIKLEESEKAGKSSQMKAALYDAVLEWSFVHPLHLVSYFTKRTPITKKIIDKETGQIREHLAIKPMDKESSEQFTSSLIQTWFKKILAQPQGWNNLEKQLANFAQDRVPPRGYFVSIAKQTGQGIEIPCGLRYGKTSPLGRKSPRMTGETPKGTTYGDPYMALVEGIWDFDGVATQQNTMTPMVPIEGDKFIKGKTNHIDGMIEHNSRRILLDPDNSPIHDGSVVLVRALFMPRHSAWLLVKRVRNLQDLIEMDDDLKEIFKTFGQLVSGQGGDPKLVAKWRRMLRETDMPEKLKQFDDALRLREGKRVETSFQPDLIAEAKDPLSSYKSKRKFDKTPEPEGKEAKGNKHRFVIQYHSADRAGRHYDLRLENEDGALSSWSIPKHHLPKGKEKLLAVKTEDHPIDYLKFKGVIPKGSYGAGTMEIYDSGTYEEIEHTGSKIVFKLKGKKEKGTYRLFKTDGKRWLIMSNGEKKAEASSWDNEDDALELAMAMPDEIPFSKIAKKHTGAMLAIMAPPDIVKKMKKAGMVNDKDIYSCLHLTLLYLGKSSNLKKATLEAIKRATEKVCSRHQPLEMCITGAGLFKPEDEGTPVYVVPNAKGLSSLQADLEEAIGNIVDLPSKFGWAPHMTVEYSCEDKPKLPDLTEKLEWTADKVRFQVGGEKFADIPIGVKKKADVEFPLSKWADRSKAKPLFREPGPDQSMWKGIWEKYEDPIKHMREDKPRVILPHNIPDWDVVVEGLETPQVVPPDINDMEKSDPKGYYYVIDAMDRIVARYNTKEKAIKNAENSKWAQRVMYSKYEDPWDAVIYETKPVIWEKPREYVEKLLKGISTGPYYLVDYWGRQLASYADLEQAIKNAERNMYVSHIVASITGDIYNGKIVWQKPEPATIQSFKKFPFSKRAMDRLPIHHDPVLWTNEQLIEAVNKPELFQGDNKRFQRAVEQLAKRNLAKKPEPKEIGKWREQGHWLLMWGGIPLAFYDNDAKASMAKRLLVQDFAENGVLPNNHFPKEYFEWRLSDNVDVDPSRTPEESYKRKKEEQREVLELLQHPMRAKQRKQLAETSLNIFKAPNDFTPSKTSIPTGAKPTVENSTSAEVDITNMDYGQIKPAFIDALVDSQETGADAADEFVADAAKRLTKKFQAEEAGLDPEKLADDIPFSQHTKNYQ